MQRISVIGISGSGKSTLARRLASHLDAPHIELDGIFHQADWTPLPTDEFRARVREHVAGERWVIDGNYTSRVRDLIWDAADTIVWPDLPRRVIFPRLLSSNDSLSVPGSSPASRSPSTTSGTPR